MVIMTPLVNGREIAFLNTGVSGVREIIPTDNSISIIYQNGTQEDYRELNVSLEDQELEFSYSTSAKSSGLTCRFSDKSSYQINHLWVKKSKGNVYATIQYELEKTWFNNSPKYKIHLVELASYMDSITTNQTLSKESLKQFFHQIILPKSNDDWELTECKYF